MFNLEGKPAEEAQNVKGTYDIDEFKITFYQISKKAHARLFITYRNDYPSKFWDKPFYRIALAHFILSRLRGNYCVKVYKPSDVVISRSVVEVGRKIDLKVNFIFAKKAGRIREKESIKCLRQFLLGIRKTYYKVINKRELANFFKLINTQLKFRRLLQKEGILCFIPSQLTKLKNFFVRLDGYEITGLALREGEAVQLPLSPKQLEYANYISLRYPFLKAESLHEAKPEDAKAAKVKCIIGNVGIKGSCLIKYGPEKVIEFKEAKPKATETYYRYSKPKLSELVFYEKGQLSAINAALKLAKKWEGMEIKEVIAKVQSELKLKGFKAFKKWKERDLAAFLPYHLYHALKKASQS